MIVDGGELVITFQLLPFNGQFSIKKMKVAVVKYNAGNIRSVDYALKRLGVEAVITADEAVLRYLSRCGRGGNHYGLFACRWYG